MDEKAVPQDETALAIINPNEEWQEKQIELGFVDAMSELQFIQSHYKARAHFILQTTIDLAVFIGRSHEL